MATFTEELKISGEHLVEETKRLIHEGNVRHIVIKNDQGHTIMEVPVSYGVVGAILAPVVAAIAAIAVLAAHFTIVVTREEGA